MKKKIFAIMLIAVMVLSSFSAVFADEETGTITVANAAKGETYKAYKLFDATVDGNGAIAYTGEIPASLSDYFTKDSAGNISKAAGKSDAEIAAKVQEWAAAQEAAGVAPDATAESEGGAVELTVPYGYYAITSTQGAVVTVDSTNPNAEVYDKNTKTITAEKEVEKESYSVGDTVKYTGKFDTTNYMGADKDAKQVVNYVISDTLPEFIEGVKITSVKIMDGDTVLKDLSANFKAFTNKQITIPWATEDAGSNPKTYTSLYKNGAKIVIEYEGTLTDVTNVNTADTNTISIRPTVWNPDTNKEEPWEEEWKDDEIIKTYGAALKKVDKDGNALTGAKFTIKGLKVKAGDAKGEYIVVSYDPTSNEQSAELETNDEGILYIVGLAEGVNMEVTETVAPKGYNKLTEPVDGFTSQQLTEAIYTKSGKIKYDEKGNVVETSETFETEVTVEKNLTDLDPQAFKVENNKGVEMPATGGMGTTILYIVGAALVLGAGAVLVTRRKADR